jgi:hypothetical protein
VHVRKRLVTPTLVVLGGAVLVTAVSAATGPTATGPAEIRITDVEVSHRVISPRGVVGAGTLEIVRQQLYNPSLSRKPIGRSTLACTYLGRRERSCSGTYFLPKGELVVAGAIESRLLYQIALIGGTGIYDNARGTLTVTSTHLRPRHEVLVFRLSG